MKQFTVIVSDDKTEWYNSDNQLDRDDGPAAEYASGNKYWYKNGQQHRDDGPAVEYASGTKCWYRNNELHSDDGPAIEHYDGSKNWYKNDKRHREDGPAIEYHNGNEYYFLENVEYCKTEYYNKINKINSCSGKIVEIDGKKYTLVPV